MHDGVVAHLGVREGNFVTPASNVMSIARNLIASGYSRKSLSGRLGGLFPDKHAEVELDYLPGRTLARHGRLRVSGTRSGDTNAEGANPLR